MPGDLHNFFTSRGFILLLLLLILISGLNFFHNYKKINSLQEEIELLHHKIELAQEKKTMLKAELENINNPEYIEKIAREKLGLVKPGELLLIPVKEEGEN